jgi:hypothetical protein
VQFRGRGLREESAFFLGLAKKQIPRFARDDNELLFSAGSKGASIARTLRHGYSRALQSFASWCDDSEDDAKIPKLAHGLSGGTCGAEVNHAETRD